MKPAAPHADGTEMGCAGGGRRAPRRGWGARLLAIVVASLGALARVSAGDSTPTADAKRYEPPYAFVNDAAGLLSAEQASRLRTRLDTLRTDSFVRVYVYTLPDAGGRSIDQAMQALYRDWRMKDRELWDGLATIFVFAAERQARLFLGQGAPEGFEAAARGIEGDLAKVFDQGPEAGLGAVIERLDSILRGLPRTFLDSPPVPADPEGPIYGASRLDPGDAAAVADALARASAAAGHRIVLAFNPAKGFDSPDQRTEKLAAAWPGTTILAYFRDEALVLLRPADDIRNRFPDTEIQRLRGEVSTAMMSPPYRRTLIRAIGEIGTLAQGKVVPPWVAWRHPYQTISGGQDAELIPPALALILLAAVLGVLGTFLYYFYRDPRTVLIGLAVSALEGVLGGGGGGSGSGGGFSGGGGRSGGGGASGSW